MNKVLSHSSKIVTLLSVLEETYVAPEHFSALQANPRPACGSFCVSAVPSEILKLLSIHPRNVLVLGTSPILLHPNMYQLIRYIMTEGSLEAKLPTIWTDEKQSREEAERRERLEERRSEKRKSQKKEDADARKGRNVVKH